MPEHACYDSFWGSWSLELSDWLDLIATADALKMSEPTYLILCSVQREIERAVPRPDRPIPDHIGGGTAFTEAQEAMLRAVAQTFLDRLAADQSDVSPGSHVPFVRGWLTKPPAEPETTPHNAVMVLVGGMSGTNSGGLLGKIRNSLGS